MKQEKTSTQPNARWPGSGKLLTMPTVAAIVLSVLFLTGCAAHRKSVTKAKEEQLSETIRTDSVIRLAIDSVSELVEIRTEPVKVPMSAVTLTIATDSLRSLPAGASYSERSGQASVKVSRKAATATENHVEDFTEFHLYILSIGSKKLFNSVTMKSGDSFFPRLRGKKLHIGSIVLEQILC